MTTLNSPAINPCYDEGNISMKCLNDNGYDQDKCEKEFENYRTCKKFWGSVERQRRFKGITPTLPSPEERERIKDEFMRTGRLNPSVKL